MDCSWCNLVYAGYCYGAHAVGADGVLPHPCERLSWVVGDNFGGDVAKDGDGCFDGIRGEYECVLYELCVLESTGCNVVVNGVYSVFCGIG